MASAPKLIVDISAVETSHHAAGTATFSRRDWLHGFAGLCAALSLHPALEKVDRPLSGIGLEDWIARIIAEWRDDAIALGRAGKTYLTSQPLEAAQERLTRLLVPEGWTANTLAGVIENVQRDWIGHNVAVVDGWVLARTEARLCGAIFLTGVVPA